MTLDELIKAASNRTLLDAAHYLMHRDRIFTIDVLPTVAPNLEMSAMKASVDEAMTHFLDDREAPISGRLLQLLKQAHPTCEESVLKNAIRCADKLDRDSGKYFKYGTDGDYFQEIQVAMQRTKEHNPGFSTETYQRVENRLSFEMR